MVRARSWRGQAMQFLKPRYRINMPMNQGSITPIASSATAIQSGGRLPLLIPFKIAMISAANAQTDVIGGITSHSLRAHQGQNVAEMTVACHCIGFAIALRAGKSNLI